ncbi:hypothetical protein CBFG_03498 [Clostridiales bacterium 1_7_47FAA]|nr:hypothetical protein CBFG_03498 [Clostridiales bacterium 1_7_47FAA]
MLTAFPHIGFSSVFGLIIGYFLGKGKGIYKSDGKRW